MKKTLKRILAVSLVVVMTLCLTTGCKKKATPENLLSDMKKNMDKIESFAGNLKMAVSMSDGTTTLAANIDMDMESTQKPEAAHINGSIGINMSGTNINTDIEMYQVKEDKEDVVYVKVMEQWAKTTGEDGESFADAEELKDLGNLAENFTLKKELSEVEGETCFELTGEIKGDDLKDIMNEDLLNSMGVGEIVNLDKMEDAKIPCTIDIYKESILPARMYIDMSGVMEKLLEDTEAVPAIEEYYMEIIYKDYDSIDEIKVPDDVKKTAVESDSDLQDELEDEFDAEDGKASGITIAEPSAELGKEWNSYTVQLNNKVVTLPCTIADIEAAGLTMDVEYTPKDYVVNAGEYELAYFADANGNEIMVDMVNGTGEAKTVAECVVGGITVTDYDLDEGGLAIVFPGNVQMGSSLEDVIAAYGETDDVYEGDSMHMYTWYDGESYQKNCEIDFDPDTKSVIGMMISAYDL